ncbi:MAG: potassium channel family protein [Candidatus Sericytochromatia bacterium]
MTPASPPAAARRHHQLRRTARRRFKRAWRSVRAEARHARLIWREFRWSLLFTALVWGASVVILHEWYPVQAHEEAMSWSRAAYYVLMMTAFEAALEFHPTAPLAVKAVYFALPVLGAFVIIDSIARFTGIVFRRRINQKEWQELLASTYSHHVIVCGLGHVGVRIVQQLVANGTDCVAIEQEENAFVSEVKALGVPVLIGDVRKPEVLTKALVAQADAIVAATDNDLVNIECGLTARELAPGIRVVLRMFDQALAKKIEKSFDFEAGFSTSALAAPVFAAAAVTRNVIHSFVVEDTVLNTVELVVRQGAKLEGRTIDSLRAELEVTFLMAQSGKEIDWNPPPGMVLEAGTKVLVVTTLEALRELEHLNEERKRFSGLLPSGPESA